MFSSCDIDISDLSGWAPTPTSTNGYMVSASVPAWHSVPSYSGFCRKCSSNNILF